MAHGEFLVSIQDQNPAQAERLAVSLSEFVRATVPDIQADLRRGDKNAMDFGATLAVILGTPAVIALAKGIADWLRRCGDPAITIETPDGRRIVVARDLPPESKKEIILEALRGGAAP